MQKILVTNYSKGIKGEKIDVIFPEKRVKFNKQTNELCFNDSVFHHVFKVVPVMRNIKENKSWFNSYIFHLK